MQRAGKLKEPFENFKVRYYILTSSCKGAVCHGEVSFEWQLLRNFTPHIQTLEPQFYRVPQESTTLDE